MVSLWGCPIKASNLPWVLLGLSLLTGGDPFKDLIGIAAGHTFIYLKLILPQSHGYNILNTPRWAENLVKRLTLWANNGRAPPSTFGMGGRIDTGAQADRPAAGGGARFSAFGGSGVRLGGN